jgi:diacylglycerol O-acyltransferase
MASIFLSAARQGAQYATFPALVSGCLVTLHRQNETGSFPNSSSNFTSCEAAASSSSSFFLRKQESPRTKLLRRRMTPVGRFSLLSETKSNPSIPVLVLALSGKPLSADNFRDIYDNRGIGDKHYRFRSITKDLTHFSLIPSTKYEPQISEVLAYPMIYRTELKNWIADALLDPMDLSKSLWQVATTTGGVIGQSGAIHSSSSTRYSNTPGNKTDDNSVESLVVFRAHHCMADGVSLGAIFVDLMDEKEEFQELLFTKIEAFKKQRKKKSWLHRLFVFVYYWGWGSIKSFSYQFYLYFANLKTVIFHSNPWRQLQKAYDDSRDDGINNTAPRTLSWVQISTVDEVKRVADYFSTKESKVTINDIFCSCISAAIVKLMRFHQSQHPDMKLSLPYMNLVMPVHMFGGVLLPGQSMGNKIGAMISRIPGQQPNNENKLMDPGERLLHVHQVLHSRKQTPAAVWSYLLAKLVGSIGVGGTSRHARLDNIEDGGGIVPWIFEKSHANASAVVTNIRGPEKIVHLDGRRVEATLGFLPLPPGIPLGMVVQSYANRLSLTVIAEPWAVPDVVSDQFVSWVVEEYEALKKEASLNPDS